jgi:hypothetical protein
MIEKNNLRYLKYYWSLFGGLFFLCLTGINNQLSLSGLIKSLIIFVLGTFVLAWTIFWYNNMREIKNRKAFLIFLILLSPVVVFAIKTGNTLGTIQELTFGFIPLLIFLPIFTFLIKRKNDIVLRIIAVFSVFAGIAAVLMFYGGIANFASLKCLIKSGTYQNGKCLIENLPSFKESLFGTKIIVPEQADKIAFLKQRWSDNLSGNIINTKTGGLENGKVTLLSEKISSVQNAHLIAMPFIVNLNGIKYYYLGLFDVYTGGYSSEKYFDGVRHLDSYPIGKNIKLGKVSVKNGSYNYFITQEYFEPGENIKKEIKLRVGGYPEKFYSDKDCDEAGQLVKKTRGDGKEYKICILSGGGQCEIESYKNGNCPPDGYDVSKLSEAGAYCLLTGHYPKESEGICHILEKNLKCSLASYYKGECE